MQRTLSAQCCHFSGASERSDAALDIDPCDDVRVDAMTQSDSEGKYGFAFRKDYYFKFSLNDGIVPGSTRKISDWEGLRGRPVDAIYRLPLKNFSYGTQNGGQVRSHLPPRFIIFQGDLVYKYNHDSKELIDGYPKKISEHFPGIPDNITAVFHRVSLNRYKKTHLFFIQGEISLFF